MLKEAELYRLEDIAQRERVASKNSLQSYVFSVQQAIKEVASDKISNEEQGESAGQVQGRHERLEDNQNSAATDMQAKLKEVQEVCSPLMIKMHMG
ncbi:hypothetical protein MTO96_034203 [Rhipicephalus appendiculatus]